MTYKPTVINIYKLDYPDNLIDALDLQTYLPHIELSEEFMQTVTRNLDDLILQLSHGGRDAIREHYKRAAKIRKTHVAHMQELKALRNLRIEIEKLYYSIYPEDYIRELEMVHRIRDATTHAEPQNKTLFAADIHKKLLDDNWIDIRARLTPEAKETLYLIFADYKGKPSVCATPIPRSVALNEVKSLFLQHLPENIQKNQIAVDRQKAKRKRRKQNNA